MRRSAAECLVTYYIRLYNLYSKEMKAERWGALTLSAAIIPLVTLTGASNAYALSPDLSIVGTTNVTLLLTSHASCLLNQSGKPTTEIKSPYNAYKSLSESKAAATPTTISPARGSCWSGTVTIGVEDNGPAVRHYTIKPIRYPTLSSALTVTDATISLVYHPTINGYNVTSLTLKVLVRDNWSSSLTFALVAQGPDVNPVVATITIVREPQTSDYWWPIIAALFFSIAVSAWIFWSSIRGERLSREVNTTSSWSFKDSWVSTLTALGAVAGTVLGATGFLADVFPGVDVQRFFTLLILFTAAVLAAPLVYAAASKTDKDSGQTLGTVGGLWLATALTLFGVAGEFATIGSLVWLADTGTGNRAGLTAALSLISLIIAWYAHSTVGQVIKLTSVSLEKEAKGVTKGPVPIL
jgi:hypothetical protein